jgi:hypothetical protein
MGTWVAVVYDIIGKIRELATQGEKAAEDFVAELDTAIAQQTSDPVAAIKRLQGIENGILEQALNEFEFITPQDQIDLERLKQDRHLCVHPAFTPQATLFQPSPELVRAHIVHAIGHLLQHPPVQGKSALARLKSDLLQPSFPTDQKTTNEFMEMRYLNHTKRTTLESFVTVFLKVLIKQSEPHLVGKENSILRCLIAVAIRQPEIFEKKMAEQLPRLTAGSNDAELQRCFVLFKADKRCWTWLEPATRIKMAGVVNTYVYDAATIDLIIGGLESDAVRPLLMARITSFISAHKHLVFLSHPRKEFLDQAIDLYTGRSSYNIIQQSGKAVIRAYANLFQSEHIQRFLDAVRANNMIDTPIGSPEFIVELFGATADLQAATKATWQAFMTAMLVGKDPEDRFAYPGLRAEMERAGIWPV